MKYFNKAHQEKKLVLLFILFLLQLPHTFAQELDPSKKWKYTSSFSLGVSTMKVDELKRNENPISPNLGFDFMAMRRLSNTRFSLALGLGYSEGFIWQNSLHENSLAENDCPTNSTFDEQEITDRIRYINLPATIELELNRQNTIGLGVQSVLMIPGSDLDISRTRDFGIVGYYYKRIGTKLEIGIRSYASINNFFTNTGGRNNESSTYPSRLLSHQFLLSIRYTF
jgi:hypothetical protein